jgi:hypothetical protein
MGLVYGGSSFAVLCEVHSKEAAERPVRGHRNCFCGKVKWLEHGTGALKCDREEEVLGPAEALDVRRRTKKSPLDG